MWFAKYVACTVFGFLSALLMLVLSGALVQYRLQDDGIAIPPNSVYDANGNLPGQSGKLANYEMISPYSQLRVVETGGDTKGEDNLADVWYVSIFNRGKPPVNESLGVLAVYEDSDSDGSADELLLSVGHPTYQRHVKVAENPTYAEHLKTAFTISCEGGVFIVYHDWDYDGVVDVLTESQNKVVTAQWLIWERKMYKVSRRIDKEKRIFEIEIDSDEKRLLQWGDEGWVLKSE